MEGEKMTVNSKKINSQVKKIEEISDKDRTQMLRLMQEFYENVFEKNFNEDLKEKDYCLMLYNEEGDIKGFSTQQNISMRVEGKTIKGVFSGDTIIHKDYWGSMELYKEFARKFIKDDDEEFYWFLISKGYKTYKMLPLFFKDFYPNYKTETPKYEKKIMDTFGRSQYPEYYDKSSGVIKYKEIKDKLKDGVADITERQLRDKDIQYFTKLNPGHIDGQDLVCLARLNQRNSRSTVNRLLRGV